MNCRTKIALMVCKNTHISWMQFDGKPLMRCAHYSQVRNTLYTVSQKTGPLRYCGITLLKQTNDA